MCSFAIEDKPTSRSRCDLALTTQKPLIRRAPSSPKTMQNKPVMEVSATTKMQKTYYEKIIWVNNEEAETMIR